MTIAIGSNVTVQTPAGPLTGRVVGTELRDTGRCAVTKILFLCVRRDADGVWQWLPASQVTT